MALCSPLLQTERAINLYTFATLPRRQFEDYVHGASAKLIGWGLNETGGAMQQQLQQVDLMVFSDEECAARHSERPPHASNVCGGVPEGGRGQCSVSWWPSIDRCVRDSSVFNLSCDPGSVFFRSVARRAIPAARCC